MKPQPCPFCNKSPQLNAYSKGFYIVCSRCEFKSPDRLTVRGAKQAWNRIRVEPVKKARKR